MEDVFILLQCDDQGLTEEEAARRIGIFGPNKVRLYARLAPFGHIADPWSSTLTARGKARKPIPPVPFLHVEPLVLGHGRSRPRRYRPL